MSEKRCYTVQELQEILGVSRPTVYNLLKKTDRYWLVHKNVFESKEIAGKMRINIASFEKWYANQIKYHKVTGEERLQKRNALQKRAFKNSWKDRICFIWTRQMIMKNLLRNRISFWQISGGRNCHRLESEEVMEILGILHLMKHHIWQKSAEA